MGQRKMIERLGGGVLHQVLALFLPLFLGACLTTKESISQHMGLGATSMNSLTADSAAVYVVNSNRHIIEKIVILDNSRSNLAGTVDQPGSVDGPVATALFKNPQSGVFVPGTGKGKLIIADTGNCAIREIDLDNLVVSSVAGTLGACGILRDGSGSAAQMFSPRSLAKIGSDIYFADASAIRKLSLVDMSVVTVAGVQASGNVDGPLVEARFTDIAGMAEFNKKLYVVERARSDIRLVDLSNSSVSTIVGHSGVAGAANGIGLAVYFNNPSHITSNGKDALYISDTLNNAIRRLDPNTLEVTTVLGGPQKEFDKNGPVKDGAIVGPVGIVYTSSGLFISNPYGVRNLR